MKNTGLKFGLLMLIAVSFLSKSHAQITISGEFRPRTEYLHGFGSLIDKSEDAAFWTEQRSRLNFNFTSEKYKVGMVLQDIRVWGSTSQLNKSDDFSSFHEIWAEVVFDPKWSLKLGRQELIYDDHRIFGNVGWAQQARSHDLAKLKYRDSTLSVDIGLAFNQDQTRRTETIFTVPNNYKTLQYLWLNKSFKNLAISVLFLNNGLQASKQDSSSNSTNYSVEFSQTIGTHLHYKKDRFKAIGSFYYQTGKDVNDKDIDAYNLKAEVMYNSTKNTEVGIGYELLSGSSQTDGNNSENNSFNPFYGTNHKFNGFMDYFFVGNHLNSVGLQDLYLKFSYKKDKLKAGIDAHLFAADESILDPEKFANNGQISAMDDFLGVELDLTLKYQYSNEVNFQLGYSHMLADDAMEALRGGDKDETNNWAYLMITFKPVFFKSKAMK